jgi:cytidine deaminase
MGKVVVGAYFEGTDGKVIFGAYFEGTDGKVIFGVYSEGTDGKVIVGAYFEGTDGKVTVEALLKGPFQRDRKNATGFSVSRPKFEADTFGIKLRSFSLDTCDKS